MQATSSPASRTTRRVVRAYRRLIRLVDRLIRNPEQIGSEPVDHLRPGSDERRLVEGLRGILGRLQVGQQALRASEQRFQLVMEGANDGIWDWNLETNVVYYSPRWKALLGYADHEIPNSFGEWRERVHPDDQQRARSAIDAYLSGATPTYELEHRLLHRDGTYRWIRARGAALRDAQGRAYRLAGSHTDITDARRVEEALREREAQYRGIFDSTTDGLVLHDLATGEFVEANPAFCRMHAYTREELFGTQPYFFVHPGSWPLLHAALESVRRGEPFHCQATDVRKDGSHVQVEVHGTVFTLAGRPCVLSVVRDISERVQAYQTLEHKVEERTRELSTLLEVSNTVASTLELKPLLGLILDQLKVVADYSGSSLLTLEGDELLLVEARGASARGDDVVGLRFPMEPGTPIVELFDRRLPVIVGDVHDDSILARAYRGAVGGLIDTAAFGYVRSWLAVPLVLNDQVTGMLSLSHSEPDFYTPQHARFAAAIANQAAIAIENARLYQRAQSLAVIEERQRLARELHDSVTQSLFSMTMIAGALPRLLERDRERAHERCERLHELAQGALAEMRALIFELHPESLEREGLAAALEKQAAALRARHGIKVEVEVTGSVDASLEVQEALFRIAQEAMNNTVKHARARGLSLRLVCDDAALTLEVRDDGVGFDPTGPFPGHLGHRSMRERAEARGGALAIESAPGQGTCIRARIPRNDEVR